MTVTIQWPRFLIVSIVGAVVMLTLYGLWTGGVVAALSLSPGYPSRPPEQVQPLIPFLSAVSVIQLVVFCFLYLRAYPQRSLSKAIWWGAWGGFFMVIPDGQFFVGTPNMSWSLLAMDWAQGIVTAMLMMAFFQLVYTARMTNAGAHPGSNGRAS